MSTTVVPKPSLERTNGQLSKPILFQPTSYAGLDNCRLLDWLSQARYCQHQRTAA